MKLLHPKKLSSIAIHSTGPGLKGSEIQLPVIMGIIGVRYIALPLFGILIVRGGVYLGLVKLDPLYQFILLLQFALPPAMNIGARSINPTFLDL